MVQLNGKPTSPLAAMIVLLVVMVGAWLLYDKNKDTLENWSNTRVPRYLQGEIFGSYPMPTQPTIQEEVVQKVQRKKKQPAKMVVKMLPVIAKNAKLPHTYWGLCTKCHLIKGGAPPGSQPITPVGKVLEKASMITKVGPPIYPDSTRHHPAAGRCIKCHDIVVKLPPN
ncbi:magnetosome protein MamT [Magnetococcus sp. PR-3]|uniref:magnetosome protein MamT n=1 Tax=Magnetococcus sp. PR-3 TaxID=3120355 RepID=UPI002FCE0A66